MSEKLLPESMSFGLLFSPHYLVERLPLSTHWNDSSKLITSARSEIKKIYKSIETVFDKLDEAQIEEEFIRPVLRVLKIEFDVQTPVLSPYGIEKKPDYAFFSNRKEKIRAIKFRGEKESDDYFKLAKALCDAKRPTVKLDLGGKNNPSIQVRRYLRITGVKWGILTNGRLWRIYFKDSPYSLNLYYQVDLISLLESDFDFRYFFCFFSSKAFEPIGKTEVVLDRVYKQSNRFTSDLGADLTENVFRAVKYLVEGYLTYLPNKLSEIDLEMIYDKSLILLYRLLFILYTESRAILPIYSKKYEEISLLAMREEIKKTLKQKSLSVPTTTLYNRLKFLFNLIDQGSIELGVSKEDFFIRAYNGGLFSNEEHSFITEKELSDNYIANAIHAISTRNGNFLDYNTLAIQHLGSIYESLLEFKVKVAETDLTIVKQEDKEIYIEFTGEGEIIVRKGEIYLVTDRGERKLTGSYFTPDYIVKYIVEKTLEPLVDERIKATNETDPAREVFKLQILDPAMGSGHFLIETVNYLTIKYLELTTEESEDINPNEIKRKIVSKCIYGVDKNPLATELAKVSLWIDTVSENEALHFLDHRLKVGNSLCGIDVNRLYKLELPKNADMVPLESFFEGEKSKQMRRSAQELLKQLEKIVTLPSSDADFIRIQRKMYKRFKKNKFRQAIIELANAYLSYYFGNKSIGDEYEKILEEFGEFLTGNHKSWKKLNKTNSFKIAQQYAVKKQYFHWQIEFPEIFLTESPGFSAIVGNPPWGEEVIQEDKHSLSDYFQVPKRNLNAFDLFFRRAINSTSSKVGFLIPRNAVNRNDYVKLRKFIIDNTWILNIYDWKLFPGVTQECISIIISKKELSKPEKIEINSKLLFSQEDIHPPLFVFNIHSSEEQYRLKEKIKNNSQIGLLNSLLTAENSLKRGEEISKAAKIIQCPNCKKWRTQSSAEKIKCKFCKKSFYSAKWVIESMRSVVQDNKAVLVITGDDIERYYLNPVSHMNFDWDGIKTKASLGIYTPNKILIKKIEKEIVASFDPTNSFYTQNVYGMRLPDNSLYSPFYILGILNSKALNFFYEHGVNLGADWTTAVSIDNIRQIFPIPAVGINVGIKGIYSPDEIDVLVDIVFLSHLSRPRCLMNNVDFYNLIVFLSKKLHYWSKKLRDERNGFLDWIQNTLSFNITEIKGKTYLFEYWQSSFETVLRVLKNNKTHLTEDPSSRKLQQKLKTELDSSLGKNKLYNSILLDTLSLLETIIFHLYSLSSKDVKLILQNEDPEFNKKVLKYFNEVGQLKELNQLKSP